MITKVLILALIIAIALSQKPEIKQYNPFTKGKDGLISGNDELQNYVINSKQPIQYVEVPANDLKNTVDYGYAFWYRFSMFIPNIIGSRFKAGAAQEMCLAHLSDNGYPLFRGSSNELGDNALATYQRGYNEHYYLNYVQRYYIKSSGAKGNEINQRLDIVDADSNWNFFYAGFSSSTKKVVFYIKGGYTGEIKLDIQDGVDHTIPASILKFAIGWQQTPGQFFNVQLFYTDKPSVLFTRAAIQNFIDTKALVPPPINPGSKVEELVGSKQVIRPKYSNTGEIFDTDSFVFHHLSGAAEYSIHGFAKWTASAANLRQITNAKVYKVSGIKPIFQRGNDNPAFGENLLGLEWNHKTCTFQVSATSCSFASACDNQIDKKDVPIKDCTKVENWFWFYQGYSHYKQKSTLYMKFMDSEYRQEQSIGSFIPDDFYIQLGKDRFTNNFYGMFKHVYFRVGANAYKEYQYDESFQLVKDKTCAILFSECGYYGDYIEICQAKPKMDPTFTVSSILVPPNKQIKLFNQENSQGQSVIYKQSVECIDKIDFGASAKILLQMGITVQNQEESSLRKNKRGEQALLF